MRAPSRTTDRLFRFLVHFVFPVPHDNMNISLESCWAKMDRAKEHRDILDRCIRDTFSVETKRPRIGIKVDADTRQHVLYISYLPDLAPLLKQVSLCLGDIIHNFRSALDHLTYQLAVWNTGGNVCRPKRVQFPIVDDPSHFKSARGDALREVHPDHQTIIEQFQPYHRIAEGLPIGPPFHSFAVLRDLDNADKHRPLNPVMIPPTSLGAYRGEALVIFMLGIQQTPGWTVPITPITLGTELIRATLPANVAIPEMDMAGSISPDIVLPEGWPIHHIIDRVAALIIKVIGEFQPLL
jgi:hypothetical protein